MSAQKLQHLREQIQDALPDGIDALSQLISDPGTKPMTKVKAFEALANRGGLPAVSAAVTQSVSANVSAESLLEAKAQLLKEQEQIAVEISELKKEIEAPGESEVVARARETAKILPHPRSEEGNPSRS